MHKRHYFVRCSANMPNTQFSMLHRTLHPSSNTFLSRRLDPEGSRWLGESFGRPPRPTPCANAINLNAYRSDIAGKPETAGAPNCNSVQCRCRQSVATPAKRHSFDCCHLATQLMKHQPEQLPRLFRRAKFTRGGFPLFRESERWSLSCSPGAQDRRIAFLLSLPVAFTLITSRQLCFC